LKTYKLKDLPSGDSDADAPEETEAKKAERRIKARASLVEAARTAVMDTDLLAFGIECIEAETVRAWEVRLSANGGCYWLPKSRCKLIDGEAFVAIPVWLAKAKNISERDALDYPHNRDSGDRDDDFDTAWWEFQ